jgi:predicted TIM-barrel fold metal-dependent hydrolase
MSTTTEQAEVVSEKAQSTPAGLSVIDCDVHNEFRDFRQDVLPYLAPEWKHYITNRGFNGLSMRPYTLWQGPDRLDSMQEDGTRGSAHWQVLKDQHLDAWNIEYVVMTGAAAGLSMNYLAQHEWATALASAANDWAIDNWFGRDPRIRGSILVAAQQPQAAAREIDRCADHPGVIQVILPTRSPGGVAWSDEKYDPIWAAAERNGLAVGFHLNSDGGNVNPPTTAGWPRSFMEATTAYIIPAQAELIGLLCRGVFEKFPNLRMVSVENGFGWFPSLIWRLDKHWRELRAEVPWLKRKPSEYARDHLRFTTQPMEEPNNPQHLLQMIDMMGSEEMLLFSTDYPHWNFDSPLRSLPTSIPLDLRRKIFSENAREFYRLPAPAIPSS